MSGRWMGQSEDRLWPHHVRGGRREQTGLWLVLYKSSTSRVFCDHSLRPEG